MVSLSVLQMDGTPLHSAAEALVESAPLHSAAEALMESAPLHLAAEALMQSNVVFWHSNTREKSAIIPTFSSIHLVAVSTFWIAGIRMV